MRSIELVLLFFFIVNCADFERALSVGRVVFCIEGWIMDLLSVLPNMHFECPVIVLDLHNSFKIVFILFMPVFPLKFDEF